MKSADWFLTSAEKIGLAVGLSPFVVGVTIVGIGTSLPELVSSLAGVIGGVPDVVVANAVGSNIANMLLIVGVAVIVGKQLKTDKSLIDLDLPLLAAGTALFGLLALDRIITTPEALILITAYVVYLLYTLNQKDDEGSVKKRDLEVRPRVHTIDLVMQVVGFVGLIFGSRFLISSVISISELLSVAPGVISITAVAFGTSLPELLVSVKAALRGNPSIVLGNILGSNIFNILMVVGVPALFVTLPVDSQTLMIGLPTLAFATLLFVISGISQRFHRWEGVFYILIYVAFIGKLFGWL